MGSNLAFSMFFFGVLAPALSGAAASALARKTATWQPALMTAAALCGLLLVYGEQFRWPPAQALDWLLLLLPAVAATLLLPLPPAARWAAVAALVLGATHWMLQPALASFSMPWLPALLIAALWSAYLLPSRADTAHGGAGALMAASAVLALMVGLSGSALVAQLFGALAATLAGAGLVSLLSRQPLAALPFRAALFGLAMIALFYAQIHYAIFILPLLAGVAAAPVARRLLKHPAPAFKAELLSFAVALLLASPALWYVVQQKLSQPSGYY
jgi:hypothetical protein